MKKTFLLLAATCCLVLNQTMANTITYNASGILTLDAKNFTPNFTDHTYSSLTGIGTITFPSNVTTIGEYAFANCEKLFSITLPNTVATIDDKAFYFCTGLDSIILPSSVTRIDVGAFMGCTRLKLVTIKATSPVIKEGAFGGCTGLVSVTVPNAAQVSKTAFNYVNNVVYKGTDLDAPWGAKCKNGTIDGYFVYSDATKTKLCGYSTFGSWDLTLPASVTSIGKNAFRDYGNLELITLPDNITTIEESAFYGCMHLKAITLPAKVKTLGDSAFAYCLGLKKIVSLPTSVPTTGKNCFYLVKKATPMYVPNVSTYVKKDQWKDYTNIIGIENYNLYIAGKRVTNATQDDIIGDSTVKYNPSTKTLTLHNAYIDYDGEATIKTGLDLTIECVEDNTIACTNKTNGQAYLNEYSTTTITGNGTLDIYSDSYASIYSYGALSITGGCSVISFSNDNPAVAIFDGALTIDGATLTAKGNGKSTTISGCTDLVMKNGVAMRSDHLYENNTFINIILAEEAKDDIIIGLIGGPEFTITANATNGTVTGGGVYQRGDSATLTATPNQGYEFKQWSDGTTDNPYVFLVVEDVTLEAVFKKVGDGIEEVHNAQCTMHDVRKVMRDGQLIIIREGVQFNAIGVKL